MDFKVGNPMMVRFIRVQTENPGMDQIKCTMAPLHLAQNKTPTTDHHHRLTAVMRLQRASGSND